MLAIHPQIQHSAARGRPLPAGVWCGAALAAPGQRVQPSGHAALDAALPGGGWPCGAMAELLLPHHHAQGVPLWPLLLPALAAQAAQRAGVVVFVNPPHDPLAAALGVAGLPAQRWCCVAAITSAQAWWACEQALRCPGVLAVLAWLPQAPVAVLRRLHLAAAQHQPLLWALRPEGPGQALARQASPAPLRLQLQSPGPGQLRVRVLKRRGAPLAQAIDLPNATAPWLQLLQAQAQRTQSTRPAQQAAQASHSSLSHALDRLALAHG